MGKPPFRYEVEGLAELRRALRGAEQKDIRRELGQENKRIGGEIIAQLRPTPREVGEGAGAKVRPLARAFDVSLRTGGKHRTTRSDGTPMEPDRIKFRQWGRRYRDRRNRRPFILGAATATLPKIEQRYLEGLGRALSKANAERNLK